MVAQLRNVLAAEDSTPVPEKDDDGGAVFPECSQGEFIALRIWQGDGSQARTDGGRHAVGL
jgi:hypothetical protein